MLSDVLVFVESFKMPSRKINGRPTASSAEVRRRMQAVKQRDTPGEVAIRSALHSFGLRFRNQSRVLESSQRRADIQFSKAKVAVFVDGCFWHGCPIHGTLPKANRKWWIEKINANIARDRNTDLLLRQADWLSVRIWEHEDPLAAARKIARIVKRRLRTLAARA
jgi:DNA mismatch endonuclease (patch repair protein)